MPGYRGEAARLKRDFEKVLLKIDRMAGGRAEGLV